MEFPSVQVITVKADIAGRQIKVAFQMALNEQNMEAAEALARYSDKDAGMVELRIIPRQPEIFVAGKTTAP